MHIYTSTHHMKNIGIPMHIYTSTHSHNTMKDIGTYTTHTHSRERVLAGIHHAYNKYTLSHTRYAHNTQKKYKDTNTYSHTSHSPHRKTTHCDKTSMSHQTCWLVRWLVQVGSQL